MKRYWIARDKNKGLYIYNEKPQKNIYEEQWIISDRAKNEKVFYVQVYDKTLISNLDEPSFSKIKWEDEEPKVILICW